jgi:hypothetical protein
MAHYKVTVLLEVNMRRRVQDSCVILLGIAAVCLTPIIAAAQVQATPEPAPVESRVTSATGKQVRVTEVDGTKKTGRLVSLNLDAAVIRHSGELVTVPLVKVRKVEKVGHGIWYGAVAGGVSGFIFGYGVTEGGGGGAAWSETTGGFVVGALGAAGGAGIGALIDHLKRQHNLVHERPAPRRVTTTLFPAGHLGFGMTVKW